MHTPLRIHVKMQACAKRKSCTPWQSLEVAQHQLEQTLARVDVWLNGKETLPLANQPKGKGKALIVLQGGGEESSNEKVQVQALLSNMAKDMSKEVAKAVAAATASMASSGAGQEKMSTDTMGNMVEKAKAEGECPHAQPRMYMCAHLHT